VYLCFWRSFIEEMQEELWKTKSILCVLPPDILMGVNEIRAFILQNSSMVFFARKTGS